MVVAAAIFGVALLVVLASLAGLFKPVSVGVAAIALFYGILAGTRTVTAALLAVGALVIVGILVRSIGETAHTIAVARREPRRRQRRRSAARTALALEELEGREQIRRAA